MLEINYSILYQNKEYSNTINFDFNKKQNTKRAKQLIFITSIVAQDYWRNYLNTYFKDYIIHFFEISINKNAKNLQIPNNPSKYLAEQIFKIINTHKIPHNIPVMAHGAGGRVATYLNTHYGIGSHLIIFSTRFFKRTFLKEALHNLLHKYKLTKQVAKLIYKAPYATNPYHKLLYVLRQEDQSELLSQIITPTLLIWGDQDIISPLVNGVEAHKKIKNSVLRIITDAQHEKLADPVPDALKNLIEQFINTNLFKKK